MDWEAERQTLLDLLEHTQMLLKSAQDSSLRDQQDHAEEIRLLELRLGTQIRLLKEENKELRGELEGIQGHDAMSLKPFMVREIKTVERRGKERETELLGAIESARQETQTVKLHLEIKLKSANEEIGKIERELEAAKQETKRVHAHCSGQVTSMREELTSANTHIKRLNEDLKAAKGDLQTIGETEERKLREMQEGWMREREELVSQLKQAQKALTEKEKLVSDMSSVKELDRRAELIPLKARNETLNFDKIALKQQLQQANSLFAKKEKHLQNQLVTWKRLCEQLKNRSAGPAVLSEADTQRLNLQMEGLERFQREIREVIEKVKGVSERMGESGERQQAGKALQSQLAALIDRLQRERKGLDTEDMTKKLTLTCKAYETAVNEVAHKSIAAIEDTNAAFLQQLQASEQAAAAILALKKENEALQSHANSEKLRIRSEKEMKVTEELARTKLELEQAKKGNVACMEAIQELEELIENSQVNGEITTDIELELRRFNLEITRLSKENTLLVNQKRHSDLEFAQIISEFTLNIQLLNDENASLQGQIATERVKSAELVAYLQSQISAVLSTAEEAKASILSEIRMLRETLPETSQLEQAWKGANEAAIVALRREVEAKNELLEGIRAAWEDEVAEARAISMGLRANIEEQGRELEGLKESIGKMKAKLEDLVDSLTVLGGKDVRLVTLETELQSVKATLMAKEAECEEEMRLMKGQIEAEARNAREIEATLMTEIVALRNKIVKSRP